VVETGGPGPGSTVSDAGDGDESEVADDRVPEASDDD
jgi:hypothetical protein